MVEVRPLSGSDKSSVGCNVPEKSKGKNDDKNRGGVLKRPVTSKKNVSIDRPRHCINTYKKNIQIHARINSTVHIQQYTINTQSDPICIFIG